MSDDYWVGVLILVALVWFLGDDIGRAFGGMVNEFNQTIGQCK